MTDATDLMPPCDGPRANPLLFGIAEGLSVLYPVIERSHLSADRANAVDPEARDEDGERARAA